MLARKLKISYPIVLVIAGLGLSFLGGFVKIEIDPELIFLIFLPPLLYEAAWYTSWKEFWKWRRIIASFAFLIVIVTSVVIAYVSRSLIPGFTLALGFLLGGIISPPDAISATTIMKDVKVPKRLVSIVEGESLLNDASSLIVFKFALAAVATGTFVWTNAITSFFVVIVMGTLTGLAIALIVYAIHRWLPTTPSIDIVLTFVTPYIMYVVAEYFHFSGVLAVVSGGLFLSHHQHTMLSNLSRMQGVNVWATVSFVLNGLIFMLIGLQLPLITGQFSSTELYDAILYGIIISLVLIVSRLVCTFGASIFTVFISRFIRTADSNPGWKGPILFGWAGMRGVVSLAAALSIPLFLQDGTPFPQRNLILFITFTVIIVTLVFQGLTLPYVIKKVNMEERDNTLPVDEQEKLVRKKLAKVSLQLLDEKYKEEIGTNHYVGNLKTKYETDIEELEALLKKDPHPPHIGSNYHRIYREVIDSQRALLHQLNRKAEVDEEIIRKHFSLLDLEEEKLRQRFEEV
jgi:CPA1 family monovalent cation:H+ antiporter